MAAVADTSPLILLAKVNRLTLLSELYGEVLIPPAVVTELQVKPDATSPELDRFIRSARVQAPEPAVQVRTLSADLGMGEAEAIALASEIPGAILIMDDAEGRRVAQRLGLRVTSTISTIQRPSPFMTTSFYAGCVFLLLRFPRPACGRQIGSSRPSLTLQETPFPSGRGRGLSEVNGDFSK